MSNSIFAKLGLADDASAEEMAYQYTRIHNCWIGVGDDSTPCQAFARQTAACSNCVRGTIADTCQLLTAIETRGKEAGRREVWERMKTECFHEDRTKEASPSSCSVCCQTCDSGGAGCVDICPVLVGCTYDHCPLLHPAGEE